MGELIFGIVMLTICMFLFVVAGRFPSLPVAQGGGAAFYPRFMLVLLFGLMIIYLFQNREKITAAIGRKDRRSLKDCLLQYRYWFLFVVVLILIPISFPYLGFILTGSWSVFASSMIIRGKEGKVTSKGILVSVAMAVVVSVVIYMVFVRVFIIPLPTGKLF